MLSSVLCSAALLSLSNAHGVILAAQGITGSNTSIGFQVDTDLARNCTSISPCQQDTTLIRDAEITANIVNECGRTELTGNIDVGENTENQLAAGTVTQVQARTPITVTLHQVNADGAGPYVCDMDPTGNSLGVTGQTNLSVTNNVPGVNGFSQAKTQDFNITVTMPAAFSCTGGSTGNICTVRCRNNALAGPFGGCFAVQQTDTTASANTANTIQTAQTLEGIQAQIISNNKDLPAAIAANQNTGSNLENAAVANSILGLSVTSKAAAVQTQSVDLLGGAAAAAVTSSTTTKAGKGTKATASAATASTSAATAKKGKNNNKRDTGLKWAKRFTENGGL